MNIVNEKIGVCYDAAISLKRHLDKVLYYYTIPLQKEGNSCAVLYVGSNESLIETRCNAIELSSLVWLKVEHSIMRELYLAESEKEVLTISPRTANELKVHLSNAISFYKQEIDLDRNVQEKERLVENAKMLISDLDKNLDKLYAILLAQFHERYYM